MEGVGHRQPGVDFLRERHAIPCTTGNPGARPKDLLSACSESVFSLGALDPA
jgi:hypothetical protein